MQKNIRKNKQSDKKIENKKSYSSDELNETDNPIKIYKVDVATAIDNLQKLNIMKLILQKRNLIISC